VTGVAPPLLLHTYALLKRAADLRRQFTDVHVHQTHQHDRGHVEFVAELDVSMEAVEAHLSRVFEHQERERIQHETALQDRLKEQQSIQNAEAASFDLQDTPTSSSSSSSAARNQKRRRKKKLSAFLSQCAGDRAILAKTIEIAFRELNAAWEHVLETTQAHYDRVKMRQRFPINELRRWAFYDLAELEGYGRRLPDCTIGFSMNSVMEFRCRMAREMQCFALSPELMDVSIRKLNFLVPMFQLHITDCKLRSQAHARVEGLVAESRRRQDDKTSQRRILAESSKTREALLDSGWERMYYSIDRARTLLLAQESPAHASTPSAQG
jgi:hypothetical protein